MEALKRLESINFLVDSSDNSLLNLSDLQYSKDGYYPDVSYSVRDDLKTVTNALELRNETTTLVAIGDVYHCSKCFKPLQKDFIYCPYCGRKITEEK